MVSSVSGVDKRKGNMPLPCLSFSMPFYFLLYSLFSGSFDGKIALSWDRNFSVKRYGMKVSLEDHFAGEIG